jgi:ubiquinone/menaquinone biosynthesis C-methylase UbiE
MLTFDQATTDLLERAYRGADFRRRRRANFDALRPEPGQHLLDIGCGNGLLTEELALATGPGGQVTGIDLSADMLAPARERLKDMPWVTLHEAGADAIPLPDQSVDGAMSVQVFEYIPDVAPALAEAARVIRPGGRLVIGDMLFSTLHWASDDPERMTRFLDAYSNHAAHVDVPTLLPKAMADAGFVVEDVIPVTFVDHVLRPDGLPALMLTLVPRDALGRGACSEEEARLWAEEQRERAKEGRFHFTLTHAVTVGRRL